MLDRTFNFEAKLFDWSRDLLGQEYEWGETDCGTLMIASQRVMHSEPVFESVDNYTTEIGAKRALTKVGGVRALMLDNGGSEIEFNFRQPGDIIVTPESDDSDFPWFSIVIDYDAFTSSPSRGVVMLDLDVFDADEVTVWRL